MAVDLAGNEETLDVFVDIDFTPPDVELTDPTEPLTTSQATIEVSALVSDALSGIHSATCNGTAATLDSGTASCTVNLDRGRNDVVLTARDVAGNVTSTSVRITRTGTATAFELAPTERTLVVNETTTLRLVDDFGSTVGGASWSSSDPAIVGVSIDDPPVITALQAGTVTITAAKNGLSAEASITVVAGTTLSYGATRWSINGAPGFSVTESIVANRVDLSVPDMFSVETNGTTTIVRGVMASGDVLWSQQAPGKPLMGDSFGGLVAGSDPSVGIAPWIVPYDVYSAYVRFAGPDGSPGWRFDSMGRVNRPAQAPDGTIYALEYFLTGVDNPDGSAILDTQVIVLDGANGSVPERVIHSIVSATLRRLNNGQGSPIFATELNQCRGRWDQSSAPTDMDMSWSGNQPSAKGASAPGQWTSASHCCEFHQRGWCRRLQSTQSSASTIMEAEPAARFRDCWN